LTWESRFRMERKKRKLFKVSQRRPCRRVSMGRGRGYRSLDHHLELEEPGTVHSWPIGHSITNHRIFRFSGSFRKFRDATAECRPRRNVRTYAIERPQQQTGWIEDDDALLCICIGLSVCLTLFVDRHVPTYSGGA
jgi:hypothetical protein